MMEQLINEKLLRPLDFIIPYDVIDAYLITSVLKFAKLFEQSGQSDDSTEITGKSEYRKDAPSSVIHDTQSGAYFFIFTDLLDVRKTINHEIVLFLQHIVYRQNPFE